jgi:hypothetical protein
MTAVGRKTWLAWFSKDSIFQVIPLWLGNVIKHDMDVSGFSVDSRRNEKLSEGFCQVAKANKFLILDFTNCQTSTRCCH